MRKSLSITVFILVSLAFCLPELSAQDTIRKRQKSLQEQTKQQQQQFVDADGDGYNDNAPDHDGDGLPNRLDPDWKKLQKKRKNGQLPFIDQDGDGVNDRLQQAEGEQSGQDVNMKGRDTEGSSVQNQEQNRVQKGKKKGKT
jgi:hypothetical protein